MDIAISLILLIFVFVIGTFGFISVISAVGKLYKLIRGELGEREQLIVLKSFAYTMVIIFLLHFMQLILGMIFGQQLLEQGNIYLPIISSGMPFRSIVSNAPWHIDSLIFDGFVFGIFYKYLSRSRTANKRVSI